ncbi:hypothetical protein Fmac_012531 [Flemingia macrophylla]|uniref:Regulator of Vps4 activity in the MVB pathway protein n=1 Tax=Flemingia macrophylla TaxID=520843 RepID=A0ABD1MQI9_9FABA
MLRSLVKLATAMVCEPTATVTTILYYGNLLPRNLVNLERLVRREFLHQENHFFHFLITMLSHIINLKNRKLWEYLEVPLKDKSPNYNAKVVSSDSETNVSVAIQAQVLFKMATKTRLEIIQKKKKATLQRFLKSDLAELLRSGYDYEAYQRTEWFLLEQNKLSCYELIEKFVGCISDHVEDLTKEKDCPDECKEAVPSLMSAAERFGDLPELRVLRTLFTEKFGNSLEPYINKEFVEKLRLDPPTREMKIRLLYDIAQEFSMEWDDMALKQILYTQSSLCEERPNPGEDIGISKGKESDTLTLGRKEFNDESWIHKSSSDDDTSTSQDNGSSLSSLESISEDEVETERPNSNRLIPPPYLKQKTHQRERNSKKTTHSEALPKKES